MEKRFPRTLLDLIVLLVFTTSCSGRLNDTAYLKYISSKESLFNKITFEYPSTWNWLVFIDDANANFAAIYTIDPYMPVDAYRGSVDISIDLFESQAEALSVMETSITRYLSARIVNKAEIMSDQEVELDGHPARRIISKRGPGIGTEIPKHGPSVSEFIYVLVGNSYYTISFSTVNGDRNGKFGQEFDQMIETIRFLP